MTPATLLLRSLSHHWRSHAVMALGVAVGTSVLTGALLVGDSMRGSLRQLALERLGRVDHALVAGRFFREQLAADMEAHSTRKFVGSARFEKAVPAILLRGSAAHADSGSSAGQVNLLGVDDRFWGLADGGPPKPPAGEEVLLNDALARELGAQAGDAVLLRVEKPSAVPRETALGRRSDVVATLRLRVAAVIPSRGAGRFSLQPDQQTPPNAFVPLATLQRALKLERRVNSLLVAGGSEHDSLQARLQHVLKADDLDIVLRVRQDPGYVSVESRRMVLEPAVAGAVLTLAGDLGIPAAPTLTYLANTIAVGAREVPYSTVTAADWPEGQPFGPLRLKEGGAAPAPKDDEILLNSWAADDLQARVGDTVKLGYYLVGPRGELHTAGHTFKLAGIVSLTGAAADPGLTPQLPGIADAKTMDAWDPPFPVDLKRIRSHDEDYWENHRTTPKAFVSLATGQRLWSSRFGRLTSVRLGCAPGLDLDKTARQFEDMLMNRLRPEQAGLVFQAVKDIGLRAAEGSTDFGQLFIGFSIFLIASATLLVALLQRLAVERRGREVGALLALGFSSGDVRRLLLRECGLVAAIGGVVGLAGAVGYGELMLTALRAWLLPAGNGSFLQLHLSDASICIGYAAGVGVAWVAIAWAVGALRRLSPVSLLAGRRSEEDTGIAAGQPWRRRWWLAALMAAIAVAALAGSTAGGGKDATAMFLTSGIAMLVAWQCFLSGWMRRSAQGARGSGRRVGVARLGVRNGARCPSRSVLTAGLLACATFVIVAVAANRHTPADRPPEKSSGDGGFALMAESVVPLQQDLDTPAGREALGVPRAAAAAFEGARLMPCRLRPGDDTSCLNLYAPGRPRIVGVPEAMIERGGFRFRSSLAATAAEKANPWLLLRKDCGPGVAPVFGDYNTVMWVLHSGLGGELPVTNERGETVRLRFVGLLQASVFQSELIMSEQQFLSMFPGQTGYSVFLIEAPFERIAQVAQALEQSLAEFGFDATRTAERLAGFAVVENTYLSMFQLLGGLGLALGALGLGTLMLRNVLERRGELALLRALGFRRRAMAMLVFAENGFLLVLGLASGTLSALVAVAPHLFGAGGEMPWAALGLTLAGVLAAGLVAGAFAMRAAMRVPMIEALRKE